MFGKYVQEREGGILVRVEHGFAIYKDAGDDFGYLQDMFVLPEHRKTGEGWQLFHKIVDIAKKSNKKALLTTTDTASNGATDSALIILKAGFSILKLENTLIWYILEI